MKTKTVVLTAALACIVPLAVAQSATQDLKTAGSDVKHGTEDAGKGIEKGTKTGYHKTVKETKKGYHKTAKATEKGIHKVEGKPTTPSQ